MRSIFISVLFFIFAHCFLLGQKTKLFYDSTGLQGTVRYDGAWSNFSLPQNGKYELNWRALNSEKIKTYYASGILKNARPNGKWMWQEGIWTYAIQPGKSLVPELSLRGERKSWYANFKDGKAHGEWKFAIDSIPLSGNNNVGNLKINSTYENGALSGKFIVRDKRYSKNFAATGECDKYGVAVGSWYFEYLQQNIRVIETRKYDSGILTELMIVEIEGNDTIKSQRKFDENIEKLSLLKRGTSDLNFVVGEKAFESDGHQTNAKQKFLEYFESDFLKGWNLPVFNTTIVRTGPVFRKIQYPISASDSLLILKARIMSDSLHTKIKKRKNYTNIQLNRGRSAELDVAVEYLHLAERSVKSVDSILSAAKLPEFSYTNRFSESELKLETILNADTTVRSRFYNQAFVLFPFFRFDSHPNSVFGSLYNYLKELDSLGNVHFLELDYSYQRLQKEGELLALESLLAQRLVGLDSVYKNSIGLADTIRNKWSKNYIRRKFQSYSNQDDYAEAKKLAEDLLGKMDTLLLWQKDWAKIDSMPAHQLDQYTVFEYNPYNGKHDIEVRLKRRFYNKISNQIWPKMMTEFCTEKNWHAFVQKKIQIEEANIFLLHFANQTGKEAGRLEKKIKKEKSPEKIIKMLRVQHSS